MQDKFSSTHKIKSVELALKCLDRLGIPKTLCLKNTGIKADQAEDITLAQELSFYKNIAAQNFDYPIGLEIGSEYTIENYGIWGLAIMSAETLAASIQIAQQFQSLTYTFFRYSITLEGDTAFIELHPLGDFKECLDILADRDISATLMILNQVVGRKLPLKHIELMGSSERHAEAYRDHYGCEVSFGADRYVISLDSALLNLTPPQADEETAKFCEQQCRLLVRKLRSTALYEDRIRQRLLLSREQFPDINDIAEELGLSYRSLRRQLQKEGTSYRLILNSVRYELSKDLLKDRNIPIAEIANRLGFSEPGNFSHAFKQWSQVSPREYRKLDTKT